MLVFESNDKNLVICDLSVFGASEVIKFPDRLNTIYHTDLLICGA